MAECTDAERALLDAIASGKGIKEARRAVAIETGDPDLFERAVQAELAANAAREVARTARDAYLVGVPTGDTPEFEARWEAIDEEVSRRRKAEFEAANPGMMGCSTKAVQA